MKAFAIYGKEDMRPIETELPPMEAGDLVIKVLTCGVCGADLRQYHKGPSSRYTLPVVLGHEICGEVIEVGAAVDSLKAGDRVTIAPVGPCMQCRACSNGHQNLCENGLITGTTIPGAFAEFMHIPAQLINTGGVVKVPEGVSNYAAAMAETVSCCLHGLAHYHTRVGDKVLVIGDGPVGLVFVQLLKLMGAGKVVTSGRRPLRRKLAAELGADEALDANEVNLAERFGRTFDSVIVATSNVAAAEEAQHLVRLGGDLLLFSGYASGVMMTLDVNVLHYKELHIHGGVDSNINDFRYAVELLPSLQLDKLVSGVWPLEKLVEAFLAASEKDVLKLFVEP